MRVYSSISLSTLILINLAINFAGIQYHSLDSLQSKPAQTYALEQPSDAVDMLPHRGSGR